MGFLLAEAEPDTGLSKVNRLSVSRSPSLPWRYAASAGACAEPGQRRNCQTDFLDIPAIFTLDRAQAGSTFEVTVMST